MDIDNTLSAAEAAAKRDQEIGRILQCNGENSFAVLEVNAFDYQESQVKKQYRVKSLLIHPDKTDNGEAPQAFDRLKRARDVVLEEGENEEKQRLLDIYRFAREQQEKEDHRENGDDHRENGDNHKLIIQHVDMILDKESQRHETEKKIKMQQETERQKREDEEVQERRLKKELADKWEDQRDTRVANWRSFVGKVDKKKKKKKKVLA